MEAHAHAGAGPGTRPSAGSVCTAGDGEVPEGFCAELFASLRRKDQQLRARQYLHGLLAAQGRKSIRNIAAITGDPAAAQRLHHFIADSTWDWRPIRAALAALAEKTDPARALVVHSMAIPRTGKQSVGVDEMFDPQRQGTFQGQLAYGVWLASPELTAPVNWLLFLPGAGTPGTEGPSRSAAGSTPQGWAASAALATPRDTGVRGRPVVMNVPGDVSRATLARFTRNVTPVLARTTLTTRLAVTDRHMPGYRRGSFSAQVILEAARSVRQPVRHAAPGGVRPPARSLAAAVPVRLAQEAVAGPRLLLVGEWHDPGRPPEHLWLTDMVDTPLQRLVEYADLARRVDREVAWAVEAVGLRDFSGRSLAGWHRHVTLASAAYTAARLGLGPSHAFRPVGRTCPAHGLQPHGPVSAPPAVGGRASAPCPEASATSPQLPHLDWILDS
ncbi:transposase [Streptomyces sp. p1417]|uniref:Transposase n=1 Tax=Streptomyces typhae TaxID=2681492 RepID=A0A6L6X1U3_9ACTN|nr:transposase [Streptomyces typhae]MVO87793.1 transposase [Streptomyces typhae]